MGRPKDQKQRPYRDEPEADDGASMSSAMSLHSNIAAVNGHDDSFEEAQPPPYSDNESAPLIREPPADLDPQIEYWVAEDWKGSRYTRLSPTLTTDPDALKQYIEWEAAQPPRAYIRVQGHHSETHKNRDNGSKTERVEDFDFKADVGDTFGLSNTSQWNTLETVPNSTKTYRGTLLKTRPKKSQQDTENAPTAPTLTEWCHLFCACSTPLKTFTLRHTITARNEKYLTEQLIALLRATHYRGSITITFPLHHRSVTIISPHPLNRLRNNRFVWWTVVLLQLWVITWPVLFFMTKRWEVVHGKWEYAKRVDAADAADGAGWRYYRESEEQWCRRWRGTIQRSALSGMKGGTEVVVPVEGEEGERRGAERAVGQEGFVGGALALVRGVSDIVRENRAEMGWGGNT